MSQFWKFSSILAVLALLVVMGLSTHGSVQAQTAGVLAIDVQSEHAGTAETLFICSQSCTDNDGTFTIRVNDADGNPIAARVTIRNRDLAEVTDRITSTGEAVVTPADDDEDGSDANPKTIDVPSSGATVVAVHKSSGLSDERDERNGHDSNTDSDSYQVKAFNGNRIEITYRAAGTLGTTQTLTVDNVKPSLLVTSPLHPLVIKGNTNVVFSAEVTDTGAGFPGKAADVFGENKGRIQLFVGRTAVTLGPGDFTAIDDGWQVTKTINSSNIASLGASPRGAKVPWHFVVEDQAGNMRESAGNITGKVSSATTSTVTVDAAFSEGYGTTNVFGAADGNQRTLQVSDGTTTFKGSITAFAPASHLFTVTLTGGTPAAAPTDAQLEALEGKTFSILNTQLITVDGTPPDFVESSVRTGTAWKSTTKTLGTGISAKNTSIVVGIKDVGGITTDSVTPSAFSVTGNTVNSVLLVDVGSSKIPSDYVSEDLGGADHLVFLTLGTSLGSDERPTVGIQAGVIKDNAGNALGATSPQRAADGLGPNLALSKSAPISKKEVKVTIVADEQLSGSPMVTLGRIYSTDNAMVADSTAQRVKTDMDGNEQCWAGTAGEDDGGLDTTNAVHQGDCGADIPTTVTGLTAIEYAGPKVIEDVPGRTAVPAGTPTPVTALSYTSTFKINAIPDNSAGGKFNVYVEATDTQSPDNTGNAGHETDASNSKAFTFELDRELNDGIQPVVTVSDKTAAGSRKGGEDPVTAIPKVEAVDPMIITVDFTEESEEYPGDSYRTVDLTSATLKVCNDDGSCDPVKTFDPNADLSSPDNIKFTIPWLNPKNGNYTLTVKAADTAGNNNLNSPTAANAETMTFEWKVVPATPFEVKLAPGWNLISLPFQPGSPAINSVIPPDHPIQTVMTFHNTTQTWMVARRDPETGNFVGDIPVITANAAYFVHTDNFISLNVLRPPTTTAAAAPPQPPAIEVVEGWNMVPVVTNNPKTGEIDADDYFGTLGTNWLKALAFDTLPRLWIIVSPKTEDVVEAGKGYWLYVTKAGVLIPS